MSFSQQSQQQPGEKKSKRVTVFSSFQIHSEKRHARDSIENQTSMSNANAKDQSEEHFFENTLKKTEHISKGPGIYVGIHIKDTECDL